MEFNGTTKYYLGYGNNSSLLSRVASSLQLSPWFVAAIACLAYTVVIIVILAAIIICKRTFKGRSTGEEEVVQAIIEEDHLLEDEPPPPTYVEAVRDMAEAVRRPPPLSFSALVASQQI